MKPENYGFVGLGQMGGPMATNIVEAGFPLIVFDKAGTQALAPKGSNVSASVSEVARASDTVFLSLPDGAISLSVINEIAATLDRRANVVIDLSTIGPEAARKASKRCAETEIVYIDSPVSGGKAGARAATIAVMLAGPEDIIEAHMDILKGFAKNPFYVGAEPGQGQALKILNNFLSGTALAASTEAIIYGLSAGLDMKTIIDVVSVSSGYNSAINEKFPKQILTENFDAGFATALQSKDVKLYLENVKSAGTPSRIGQLVSDVWEEHNEARPGSDITHLYKFIRDGK